jgi:hypothetical protein
VIEGILPFEMFTESIKKEIKLITDLLSSIDVSLQMMANKHNRRTTAFVNRKTIAQRLGVPTVAIDKLIFQGISSKGASGLIEGKHYCKLDPQENNSSKFLYDPYEILQAAWSNFKYD